MPTYLDLQEEIQRLRDEQQRLRDEQQKLRHEGDGSKCHQDEQGKSPEPEKTQPQTKPNDLKNDDGQQSSEKPAERQEPPLRVRAVNYGRTHPKTVLIGTVVLVLIAIAAMLLLNYLNSYESTDDAEVDGHLNAISTRIVGTVTGVYVENNQFVQAGQVLVDLDPRDYQTSLQQAHAQVAQSQAQVAAENPNVPITVTTNQTAISSADADVRAAQASVASAQQDYDAKLAAVRQAEVNHTKAALDRARFQILVDKDEISKQQFDGIAAAERNAADAIDAARASAESAKKIIDARQAQLAEAQGRVREANQNAPRQVEIRNARIQAGQAAYLAARAQEEAARLNLSYTRVVAPVSGVIVEKSVEVGMRVQPGQQLMSISQTNDIWITANFKETQLKRMKAGQSVDIAVDAFGTKCHGYVESLPGATGAITSLLPPENATGNYVKVVQRLPVRIRLNNNENRDHRLRPGMSVEPKVWLDTAHQVSSQDGHWSTSSAFPNKH